jgi:hypothetical protein
MTSILQMFSKSPKGGLLILVETNFFEFQHEIGKKVTLTTNLHLTWYLHPFTSLIYLLDIGENMICFAW